MKLSEIFYNGFKSQNLTATQAYQQAIANGGFLGKCSHVIGCCGLYHTKVTFDDGSDMFFGDDVYTLIP